MKAGKLPIALKGFSALYLEPALRLAILKASGAFDDWLSMNFIHLYASEYQTGSLIYRDGYCKLFYESTRPAVLHSFFHETDWPAADTVSDALAETLAGGDYVLLDLDEYYIPGTYYAGRVHYWRRFLFWGWEEDGFLALSHNRFAQMAEFHIPRAVLSMAAAQGGQMPNGSVRPGVALRRKEGLFQRIVYRSYDVYRQLAEYYHADMVQHTVHSDGARTVDTYGFALYDRLIDRLALGRYGLEKVDYRALAMLAEQKEGLAERLEVLCRRESRQVPDHLAGAYRTMGEEARQLLGMMLRYASAELEIRARVWEDAADSLRRIQHRDHSVTGQLLRWLE